MELPLQISFRGMDASPAVEAKVRERVDKLARQDPSIVSCRVVVEAPHRHHHQGRLFHVRVDLTVPGAELVVNREPGEHHAHEDVFVAIRDAFDAMRRQVQDHLRVRRGVVKTHAEPPVALVVKLKPEEGYGFIATPDGREVYFHANSVVGDAFGKLQPGSPVRFVEVEGEKGPQASAVELV